MRSLGRVVRNFSLSFSLRHATYSPMEIGINKCCLSLCKQSPQLIFLYVNNPPSLPGLNYQCSFLKIVLHDRIFDIVDLFQDIELLSSLDITVCCMTYNILRNWHANTWKPGILLLLVLIPFTNSGWTCREASSHTITLYSWDGYSSVQACT